MICFEVEQWMIVTFAWVLAGLAYLLMGAIVAGLTLRCGDDENWVSFGLFWPSTLVVVFAVLLVVGLLFPFVYLAKWIGGKK